MNLINKVPMWRRILVICVTVLLGCIIGHYALQVTHINETTEDIQIENSGSVGTITPSNHVSQTFETDEDFCGISFLVGTYTQKQVGTVRAIITNLDTNSVVMDNLYQTSKMEDNQYFSFATTNIIRVDHNTKFKIELSSEKITDGGGITIWCSDVDLYKDGDLYINDQKQANDMTFKLVTSYNITKNLGMFCKRVEILSLLYLFILLNCICSLKQLYENIYKYRIWIAIGLFVFFVVNKFNFSSVNQWDLYVQPGEGSQYVDTVFGTSQSIRSDEWMVTMPRMISAEYVNYGKMNNIVRATETTNMSASGLYRFYSALAKPAEWGYYLFGSEYGVSFYWSFRMIFGFLFAFELCMLLSKKNRMLSSMGGVLIWFSSFNMWWSTVTWIITGSAAIVLFNYFINENSWKKRIFWGGATAIAGANFVVDLYPAWLVPAGFVYLTLLIWSIVINNEQIKKFKIADWLVGMICIIFMISIIGVFLYNYMDYMTAIMNTVYPGSRVCYGQYTLKKMFGYLSSWLSAFLSYGNPSEMGCFYAVFPMGIIAYLINLIQKRGKGVETWILLMPTALLGAYCLFPLPELLAKITLLSYATADRAVDVLGFLNVLMLIVGLSEIDYKSINWKFGGALSALTVGLAVWYDRKNYADSIGIGIVLILAIVTALVLTGIISDVQKNVKQIAIIFMTILVLVSGVRINPLNSGLDAITSKPVAKEIQSIVQKDKDAKWLALDSLMLGDYLIACGARTYNSTNYIPNLKFWSKLDPKIKSEEIYNRYAHISIKLVENVTSMELQQEDWINLFLSYKDFEKLDVDYIMSQNTIDEEKAHLKLLYEENGVYIYKHSSK